MVQRSQEHYHNIKNSKPLHWQGISEIKQCTRSVLQNVRRAKMKLARIDLFTFSLKIKKTSAKYAKNADRIVHTTYLKNAQAIYTKPRRIDRVGFTPTILSE